MLLKKIINIYGGPCIGKSTIAAGLFYHMKKEGYDVELVTEYAKDLVYEDRNNILAGDQIYIFAKQHRRILRLKDKVEYIITDSPILLSLVYVELMKVTYDKNIFSDLVLNVYNQYPNINILLTRNPDHVYKNNGRQQNEVESVSIDLVIKNILKNNYIDVPVDEETINSIYNIIK